MARQQSLTAMSVESLLKLREDIGAVLARKADALKNELKAIGADYSGRIALSGRKSLAGRKVAIKYRDSHGNTWAGRGAQPRWMTEAIKGGAKREDFLVDKPRVAASRKNVARKIKRRSKK